MPFDRCRSYDVAIIGGGPAGCVAALQLARAGAAVLLIERRSHYSRRLGETLPPAATRALQELRIWDDFLLIAPVPAWLNASAWGSSQLRFDDFMFGGDGPGWHIDRGRFEAMLCRLARLAGACVLNGCSITALRSDRGGHQLQFAHSGMLYSAEATFLIDASGRGHHAWQRNAHRRQIDCLIGVGVVATVPTTSCVASYTLIESVEDGWFYSAQVSPTEVVVCYMTDADIYSAGQRYNGNAFLANLAQAPHTRKRLGAANAVSCQWCVAAGSSVCTTAAGVNWAAIGDAALSCDPLAASGLISALKSGIHAASVVASGKAQRHSEWWPKYLTSTFSSYLAARERYYGMEQRWTGSSFWQRRHTSRQDFRSELKLKVYSPL